MSWLHNFRAGHRTANWRLWQGTAPVRYVSVGDFSIAPKWGISFSYASNTPKNKVNADAIFNLTSKHQGNSSVSTY